MKRLKPHAAFVAVVVPLLLTAGLARPAEAATETVRCGTGGDTITRALGRHEGEPLRIEVSGTCFESVFIERDDVTVVGVTPGARIEPPGDLADDAIVRIVRAGDVSVSNLTIAGGAFPARGVQIDHAGGTVRFSNVVITDVFFGLEAQFSAATLQGVTIEADEGTALFLARHAELTCNDCDLSAGEEIATVLQDSALLLNDSTVTLTGTPSLATIQVSDSSSAEIVHTDIPGRVLTQGGSRVRLSDSSADDLDLLRSSSGIVGSGLTVDDVTLAEFSTLLVAGNVGTMSCESGAEALCSATASVGSSTCPGCPATP